MTNNITSIRKMVKTKKNIPNERRGNEGFAETSPEQIQQQFEVELCWCIQQLQIALGSGKLNQKQIQDHTKSLNALMGHNTPIIKKRQIMRLSFGDYRDKMAEEQKKYRKNNLQIKLQSGKPNEKSQFLKKAGENQFKFDFPVENSNSNVETKEENKLFKFTPSNDCFKFNFTVSE